MAALGEIKSEHVQDFINACFIIDRFPMRSDTNSSKSLTASKDVRREPCPEGMSEAGFVEVNLSLCILLDEEVRAHDKVTLMAVCTCVMSKSIRTLIAVCTTHTRTHTDTNRWSSLSLRHCQQLSTEYPDRKIVFIAVGKHAQVRSTLYHIEPYIHVKQYGQHAHNT